MAELVVTAARLFDGSEVRRGPAGSGGIGVAVVDGRIAAVDSAHALVERFRDADTQHYGEATLSPGLIDAHVHLTMPGDGTSYEPAASQVAERRFRTAFVNLRTHLEAGVTTVRDVGSHLDFLAWAPADWLVLPRLMRYGPPITSTGGHMHLFGGESATAAEAKENATRNMRAGADGIKVAASGGGTLGTVPHAATIDQELIAAAAAVAHEWNALATTHALSKNSMRRAIEAGTDGIEHLGFLTESGQSEFDLELAGFAVQRGVTFGSTLGCNNRYTARAAAGELDAWEVEEQAERTTYYIRNAARMRALGANIVAASDAGWKYTHFGDFANELRLLTLAEYTPPEVLRLATGANADYLGLADSVGYLRPGLLADLAVFDGDPTTDITAAAHVRAVYRDGERVYARFC